MTLTLPVISEAPVFSIVIGTGGLRTPLILYSSFTLIVSIRANELIVSVAPVILAAVPVLATPFTLSCAPTTPAVAGSTANTAAEIQAEPQDDHMHRTADYKAYRSPKSLLCDYSVMVTRISASSSCTGSIVLAGYVLSSVL